MSFVRIEHLARRFGKVQALADFNAEFPQNATIAFVGSNGAGKTTTLSVIGGFIRPDAGRVLIDGLSLGEYRSSGRLIGLLPQDVQFFEDRTVWRQLVLFAALSGMNSRDSKVEAGRVLEAVRLEDKATARVHELSRGMKIRIGAAQALIGHPPLVLLDEPMAGLDPKMKAAFRSCIRDLKGTTTLVISSHDLHELQELCDHVCVIDKGCDVRSGSMDDLLSTGTRIRYLISGAVNTADLERLVPDVAFAISQKLESRWELEASFQQEDGQTIEGINEQVLSFLIQHSVGVLSVSSAKSLEDSYLNLV